MIWSAETAVLRLRGFSMHARRESLCSGGWLALASRMYSSRLFATGLVFFSEASLVVLNKVAPNNRTPNVRNILNPSCASVPLEHDTSSSFFQNLCHQHLSGIGVHD